MGGIEGREKECEHNNFGFDSESIRLLKGLNPRSDMGTRKIILSTGWRMRCGESSRRDKKKGWKLLALIQAGGCSIGNGERQTLQ